MRVKTSFKARVSIKKVISSPKLVYPELKSRAKAPKGAFAFLIYMITFTCRADDGIGVYMPCAVCFNQHANTRKFYRAIRSVRSRRRAEAHPDRYLILSCESGERFLHIYWSFLIAARSRAPKAFENDHIKSLKREIAAVRGV